MNVTHKKNDLRTKLYKELNEAREKFLNLPSKEDILHAGKKYDDLRNIVYVMGALLEADMFEDEEIDAFLVKNDLLEEIYNNTIPADETDNIVEAAFDTIGRANYFSELDFG